MFMLAFHIVAIGILVALVWPIAYRRGFRAGEKKARRMLEEGAADQPLN